MEDRAYPEDPFHFAPLWDAILDVYDAFAAICRKHGLRHYVIGGTLLGAVRHKGFIPWDDDFDLAMPRQDYEKLKRVLDNELPRNMKFVDHSNTPEFMAVFGKIQDIREDYILDIERKVGHRLSNGIFIDIFVLEGYPDSWLQGKIIRLMEKAHDAVRYASIMRSANTAMTQRQVQVYMVGMLLLPFFKDYSNDEVWYKWSEAHARQRNFDDNHMSATMGFGLERFQMVFRKRIFGEPALLDFCGKKIPGPEDWNAFLTINFGADYMTPPPENCRKPTHSYEGRFPWWLGPTRAART